MLRSLSVFGLFLCPEKDHGRFSKAFRALYTTFIFLSLHYWGMTCLVNLITRPGKWRTFNQALIVWTSTASYDSFLFHRRAVRGFVLCFASAPNTHASMRSETKRRYWKFSLTLSVFLWVFTLCWVASFLFIPPEGSRSNLFSSMIFRVLLPNATSSAGLDCLLRLSNGYACFLVEGSLTTMVVFYIVCLRGCTAWFEEFQRTFSSRPGNVDMRHARHVYSILSDRVQAVDDSFSLSVLFWYLMVTVALCIRVIAVITEHTTTLTVQGMLNISFGLFRGIFVIMLGTSFSAQGLADQALEAVHALEECVQHSKDSLTLQGFAILSRRVEVKPVVVTLWSFCAIGKPFLMTCVQTMTTYVIISVQMTNIP